MIIIRADITSTDRVEDVTITASVTEPITNHNSQNLSVS